ncbi:NAD(P)-binding protein [Exidia glandulosa HHB12029]|uniref:NAD(P)-binding protein n=1 Tax=Exidia glandulosa HHB12029 TaxID=1314781 RepID=A0A165CWM9_EXIGL|nr:NAD(P)-binding protein [Exidia glandulosa HHB12029]
MSDAFGFSTTGEEVVKAFSDRVKGRVFLVTGPAPNGVGGNIATALAHGHPAVILLVGRSPTKYTPIVDAIHSIDANITVRVYGADYTSFASVRAGAEKIVAENDKIDVIINSAGIMMRDLQYTGDGIEGHFQTNHLGPFLLTNLLVPLLKKSEEPRVVNVSSGTAQLASGDYKDYNFKEREYKYMLAYGQSKLACLHYTQALVARGIDSVAVHPGTIKGTSLGVGFTEEESEKMFAMAIAHGIKLKEPAQGASTPLVAALDPKAKDYETRWMEHCQPAKVAGPGSYKEGAPEEMWKLSEKLVGQEFTF